MIYGATAKASVPSHEDSPPKKVNLVRHIGQNITDSIHDITTQLKGLSPSKKGSTDLSTLKPPSVFTKMKNKIFNPLSRKTYPPVASALNVPQQSTPRPASTNPFDDDLNVIQLFQKTGYIQVVKMPSTSLTKIKNDEGDSDSEDDDDDECDFDDENSHDNELIIEEYPEERPEFSQMIKETVPDDGLLNFLSGGLSISKCLAWQNWHTASNFPI